MSQAVSTKVRKGKKSHRRSGARDKTKEAVSEFAGDAYSLAKRAYAGVSHVLKLINIETKYFDVPPYTTAIVNTPALYYACDVTQGVTQSDRISESIKLQGLLFNVALFANTTQAAAGLIRVMLVRDLENAGALPAYSDIIDSTYSNELGPTKYENRSRFSILSDEVYASDPLGPRTFVKRQHIPHNGHIKYRGNASGVTFAAEGALFLTVSASWASNGVIPNIQLRFYYTDD
jgi:hypothetical protein